MVKVPSHDGPAYWLEPPYTEEEQRWRANPMWPFEGAPPGYDPEWCLPMSPKEESEYWAERAKNPVTHITFYGSAPHRPNRPPAKKAAEGTE